MKVKVWVLALALGIVALAPVLLFSYYYHGRSVSRSQDPLIPIGLQEFRFKDNTSKEMKPGTELEIRICKVIDGYRFNLCLENGKCIAGHLSQAAKEEAFLVVKDLMEKTTPPSPTIILRRQVSDFWIVDLYLNVEGQRVNLSDYLRSNELSL